MRVAFFGAWDPAYPRNRILRTGLEHAGVEILEVRVRERRAVFRYPALLARARELDRADVVLVPEFRHKDIPLARMLAGRRPLVFDPLVSRWDTLVHDWAIHGPRSMQARWNRAIDHHALRAADLVLCDTWEHGALFESLGVERAKLRRVLVGAERPFFEVGPPPADGPVMILYVGGFLPLHGVAHVIEAARLLEQDAALPDWRMEMIGRGIDFERTRAEVARLGLERVTLAGPRPYAEAPVALERAHVVLGAFGMTAKAGRVVPHKVYQGAAAGRAVVTGDAPALREVFTPRIHLWSVPRGDAAALAEALALMIRDPATRARLGERARVRALEIGTPEKIGAGLAVDLDTLVSR